MEKVMSSQQERRVSERIPFGQTYPYELMRSAGGEISDGQGYVVNQSARGLLLMLPEKVDQRQIFEIRLLPDVNKKPITKLMEVCWTRPLPVGTQADLHLVGAQVLFELDSSQDVTVESL
jgi:hypothetical protein